MYQKEIGLLAHSMITIIGSVVNIIGGGGLYEHLMSMGNFTLIIIR